MRVARRVAVLFLILFAVPAMADATSNAVKVQALFTPGDNIAGTIVQAIRAARHSIRVQAFNFTNKSIGRALQDAHRRRVAVMVLADQQQYEKGAAFILRDLREAGIPIKLDGNHAAAHNKIILIDDEGAESVIITGSFNFTQAAQKANAENVVIIQRDKTLTEAYRNNWNSHWQHGVIVE